MDVAAFGESIRAFQEVLRTDDVQSRRPGSLGQTSDTGSEVWIADPRIIPMKVGGQANSGSAEVRLIGQNLKLKQILGSVQEAVDAAMDGDTIMLGIGRYAGDVHIHKSVVVIGANHGIPGTSDLRGGESIIVGRLMVGSDARQILVEGVTVVGSIETELASGCSSRFVLRNSRIDGRELSAAVLLLNGADATLVSNLVHGGFDAAIRAPLGFGCLVISGNRIEAAPGSVGIFLNAAAGVTRATITRNILRGADCGIAIHPGTGMEFHVESIAIAGNRFFGTSQDVKVVAPAAEWFRRETMTGSQAEMGFGRPLASDHISIARRA